MLDMNVLYHPAENIREKGFAHITIRNDMLLMDPFSTRKNVLNCDWLNIFCIVKCFYI